MANHKSARKRARQSVVRNKINSARKSTVRTAEKRLRKALDEKNLDQAATLLQRYTSQVMKAANRGVVSVNHAARKVGRLSKQLLSLRNSA